MKKILISLLTVAASIPMYALPLGNPWEASIHCDGVICKGECLPYRDPCSHWCDAWSIRFGYYGDFVYDRHTQVDSGPDESSIHDTEIVTNAGYLAVNFWDRLDIFGILGGTMLRIDTSGTILGEATNIVNVIETDTYFSWSVGARATLWECGCLGIGAEAQYFQSRPHLNFLRAENVDTFYFGTGQSLKYEEWQFGVGAAYRINIASCSSALIPYIGIKWDRCRINIDDVIVPVVGAVVPNLDSEREFGLSVGLTLLGCNKASVTVEGRYISEKALYINGQFRY